MNREEVPPDHLDASDRPGGAQAQAGASTTRQANRARLAAQVLSAMETLWAGRTIVELRAFGKKQWEQWSGYYEDPATLARDAASLEGKAAVVYFTLNDVNPEARFRSPDQLRELSKGGKTTSDDEITRRLFLPVDLDPARLADTPSSEEQHDLAIGRANDIRAELRAEGWAEPALLDTGNGAALLYRIDIPPRDDGLVERCLKSLDLRFSDGLVHIDTTVANPARIWKVPFTIAGAKGSHSTERPHRRSALLEAPEAFGVVTIEQLKALAAILPAEPIAKRARNVAGQTFDIDRWIAEYLPELSGPKPWQRGRKWTGRCSWNAAHTNASFYIVQFESGAIAAGCHHNGCQGLGWAELRDQLEPGHREKRTQASERRGLAVVDEPEWFVRELEADPGPISSDPAGEPHPMAGGPGTPRGRPRHDGDHGPLAKATWRPADTTDLLEGEPEEVNYLVQDILPEEDSTVLVAPPKYAKSWFALVLAVSVATGLPAFGRYVVAGPRPVVWVDEENGVRRMRRRLKRYAKGAALSTEERALLVANLRVYPQQGFTLSTDAGRAAFFAAVQEFRPALVILDSLVALSSSDGTSENDNVARRLFYNRALAPLRALGAAALVLAHPPLPSKDAPKDNQRRARGAGDIIGAADWSLYLEKVSDERTVHGRRVVVVLGEYVGRDGEGLDGAHTLTLEDIGPDATTMTSAGAEGASTAKTLGKTNAALVELLHRLRTSPAGEMYQPDAKTDLEARGFTLDTYQAAVRTGVAQGLFRIDPPRPPESGKWIVLPKRDPDEE